VVIHRADHILGPWEGKLALQDLGVAQGGLIDTPEGDWYAYLFRDFGAVGRIPYLVPVKWENGWPVLGIDGKVPETIEALPASNGYIPGIVASDEFERKKNEPDLPLVWQWNHNPDPRFWSVKERKGFLRLINGRTDENFLGTRNTLTQRTFGPECSGSTFIDLSEMKEGDVAGLGLLQKKYGLVGVKFENGEKKVFMETVNADVPVEIESIPLKKEKIYLKAECNFENLSDLADFYFSLDGTTWTKIGSPLKMKYTLPHFMGYRFALFNFATQNPGGFVDFDWFRIE
jgi:beta-xylosidase